VTSGSECAETRFHGLIDPKTWRKGYSIRFIGRKSSIVEIKARLLIFEYKHMLWDKKGHPDRESHLWLILMQRSAR